MAVPIFFTQPTDEPTVYLERSDRIAAQFLTQNDAHLLPDGAKVVGGFSSPRQYGALVVGPDRQSLMILRDGTIRPLTDVPETVRAALVKAKLIEPETAFLKRQLATQQEVFSAVTQQLSDAQALLGQVSLVAFLN